MNIVFDSLTLYLRRVRDFYWEEHTILQTIDHFIVDKINNITDVFY